MSCLFPCFRRKKTNEDDHIDNTNNTNNREISVVLNEDADMLEEDRDLLNANKNNTKRHIIKPHETKGYIISNYDGDSFVCAIHLHICPNDCEGDCIHTKIRIKRLISCRLNGLDTPELRTKNVTEKEYAIIAKRYLAYHTKNKIVRINIGKPDKYRRYLCDVDIDGNSLAQMLIDEKLAVPYDGGKKIPFDEWDIDLPNTINFAYLDI